ncbi:PspC domain-containing protein [Flavobacterium sp. RHBU_24]|uniref:PspC domain-containing protein n=1 Tax=Flavobacterium sp. RHBU_24 TaxID=3391185 RepID=UPI00398505F0
MNKTVSINLGGIFFHIDEDAYQKLNRYFDAIKRSLSPDGKDEIMSDIEARIAELLSERIKSEKLVVGQREIDEIITIMGKPEDYRIDEETTGGTYDGATGSADNTGAAGNSTGASGFEYYRTKKFYRDTDGAMVSGVCAGLGHYFRLEPLWIRIIFIVVLIASFGTAALVYILLWILIPPAITTTEKLEMRGEPINISNIEKKVREEFAQVSERLKNVDYDKIGSNVKTSFERVGHGVGDVFKSIFKVIGKILGGLLTLWAGFTLGALLVGFIIVLFATTSVAPGWYPYVELINSGSAPVWLTAVSLFFAIGIPFLGLFLLGLRVLIPNMKSIGSTAGFTLLVLWIASICGCAYFGIQQSAQFSSEGKVVTKSDLNISNEDIFKIKFTFDNYYAKSVNDTRTFELVQDSLGHELILSNEVRLYVLKAEGTKPYIQIERKARGATINDARETAKTIDYSFKVEGNTLILNNYLLTDAASKWHQQEVEVYLYIPEGYTFQADSSVRDYDATDNEFFDLWYDSDQHTYMMGVNKVECFDCVETQEGEPTEELEVEIDTIVAPQPPMPSEVIPASEAQLQQELRAREIELREREMNLREREQQLKNAKTN